MRDVPQVDVLSQVELEVFGFSGFSGVSGFLAFIRGALHGITFAANFGTGRLDWGIFAAKILRGEDTPIKPACAKIRCECFPM